MQVQLIPHAAAPVRPVPVAVPVAVTALGCACACAPARPAPVRLRTLRWLRLCACAPVRLRALRLAALGCACACAPCAWLRLWLRLCPRLWHMHAVVRVLTRYNHQLHADVPPLRARMCLGRPRPGSAGGSGPGLQLHVGRGLCLRGMQRPFVRMLVVFLLLRQRLLDLFGVQQRRLGRQMCKYHIRNYHKAS